MISSLKYPTITQLLFFCIIAGIIPISNVFGQLNLYPLKYDKIRMQAYKEENINLKKSNIAPVTLTLPFFDDFSSSSGFPDRSKWLYDSVTYGITVDSIVDSITVTIDTVCSDTTLVICPDTLIDTIVTTYDTTYSYTYDTIWIFSNIGGTYINNRFCVNPPTLNVATFDGLKADGTPYNFTNPLAEGKADSLVSLPIDLRNNFSDTIGMTVDSVVVYINDSAVVDTITLSIDTVCSDTTLPVCPDILIISIDSTYDTTYAYTHDTTWIFSYFSFFWQAGGVDANLNPDPSDSIWLEFLDKDTIWNWVWGKKGNAINVGDSITLDFKQEFIAITDTKYFYNGFQFKFQSYGRLSGNYDVWHIDYVYLDTSKTLTDDFAFSNSPGSFLRRYTAMPFNQYFVNNATKSLETADTISVTTNNLKKQVLSMEILCELSIITDTTDQLIDTILDGTYLTPNQCPYQQCQLNALPDENKLTGFNSALKLKYKFKIENDSAFTSNDTISGFTVLDNYYAYDDGSAEYGIGINVPFGRAAYRFILNEPDTLTEIQMYFTQLGENHNGKTFKLFVWKHIDTVNAANDDTLYAKDVQIQYQGSINKFDSYKIDPLIWDGVVSDTFYVGWMQYTNDILNIGFDKNTNSNQHIFYNVAGQWIRYDLSEGSMMIRPVFGESGFTTAIPEYKTINRSIKIYPNPSDGVVYISAINSPSLQGWVYVYDIKGKLIVMQNLLHNNNSHQIDLSGYPDGMYFLKFVSKNLNVNKKIVLIN